MTGYTACNVQHCAALLFQQAHSLITAPHLLTALPLPSPSHQLHNIRALAVLATSAGHTLNAHIGNTLPKLLTLASQPHSEAEEDESKEAAAAEAAASIALSVQVRGRVEGRFARALRRNGNGGPCERRRGQRVIHRIELVAWRGLRHGKLVAWCHRSCLAGLRCLCCDCFPPSSHPPGLSCVSPPRPLQEDGLHLLISEMLHGLEDPARRLGTAHLIKQFAARR